MYINNQKLDLFRILVLRDIKKIFKKSPKSKTSRTFIFHNNNAEKFLTNW